MKIIPQTIGSKISISIGIALVVVATMCLSVITTNTITSDMAVVLFLIFFGGIIAVQVIPGMVLFGVLTKVLMSIIRKEPAKESKK